VEYNASLEGNLNRKSDWWHIGTIPMATCIKWAEESGTRIFTRDWQAVAKRKVQDPDYRKLNVNNIKL
jgi:hypothetical protein